MYRVLTNKYGLEAEQAFRIFDYHDSGFCTIRDLRKIISTFFKDVITSEEDFELLLKLVPPQTGSQQFKYKDLCKFLEKRFVRSFKYVTDKKVTEGDDTFNNEIIQSARNKTPVEIELERPLIKEASLNYILRKAAELQIDLRKEFVLADPLELSVLPRIKLWNILINQPLGLNEQELTEVFENDLNFDNYGNVDYMVILNSDIFVTLESNRLREKAL